MDRRGRHDCGRPVPFLPPREVESCGLMELPSEVLVMVLARVPLLDLANLRPVCRRLQQLVDGAGARRLWAGVSLEGLSVSPRHQRLIERAADCGNREALIKLAVAFLYNQGIPKGVGAGTLDSWNGTRAAELFFQLDTLSPDTRPLSWLLIRPPWSSSVSNKVCAYHKMVTRCLETSQRENRREEEEEVIPGLFYSLGQTVKFLEVDGKGEESDQSALDWFERGASHSCSFSALQVWRQTVKPNLAMREVQALRSLRRIMATGNNCSSQDALLELCSAYASGYYGSLGRHEAVATIRELMATSRPQRTHKIFTIQTSITKIMRYIAVDWMVEIAELKSLSSHTLHQAVALFDSYLLTRQVDRLELQLLGVTSILVASRWSGATMLTVRESSWLTENTYSYQEVVRMMAELLGTFHGNIKRLSVCDYLEILLSQCQASSLVHSMAWYLADSVLLHPELTCYSPAQLAAACLLNAQILLRQDNPWSLVMEEGSGFYLSSLCDCCLSVYQRCLTKEFMVADHRGVQLCSVTNRYSGSTHQSIGQREVMSLDELSECLGVTPSNGSTTTPDIARRPRIEDKLLSFLSDSCYLSSPLYFSGSESEPESESSFGEEEEEELLRCRTTPSPSPPHSSPASCHMIPPPPHHSPAPVSYITAPNSPHQLLPSSSSSLVRHSSLNRCDVLSNSGLSEKIDKVHVSCPDFHSRSTDMELGSVSQDEECEMDTCESHSSKTLIAGGHTPREFWGATGGLDYNLPSLGEPELSRLTPLEPLKSTTPHFVDRGGKKSPAGGSTRQANSPPVPLGKKFHPTTRTPLQPLENRLNTRQQGSNGKGTQVGSDKKPVLNYPGTLGSSKH